MNDKLKNTSASLAAAFCSPFLEADVEIDKDGFQRTDVIWCCDADGKSFPKPPLGRAQILTPHRAKPPSQTNPNPHTGQHKPNPRANRHGKPTALHKHSNPHAP
ncbi:hypothetical protein NHP21005_14280 [Helicobacter sp. NHP21005]|uniref:hypothetical protein n=1 Tax=Helicobacter felistomachi TaxID=3040201 RepID=UPI0025747AEF|nr:hypothetical protein [Helicobacter sp. NHP21005]BEG57740.1 hypothetical protein NHP21005_14280 [Helicobacter sp. NHP21005]